MDINEYIKEKIKNKNKQNKFSNSTSSQKNKYISLNNANPIENRNQYYQNSYYSNYTEYNKNIKNQFGNNNSINSYLYNKNKENKFSEMSNYEKNSSFNTIDIPGIRKIENFNFYNIDNKNGTNTSYYMKNSRINRNIKNLKTQNYKVSNSNTKNKYTNNYYNNELEYMNIKLNLKVLEHKLSKLTNILTNDDVFIPRVKRNIDHLLNRNINNNKVNTNIIIDENGNVINSNRNKIIDFRNNQQNNYEININNNYGYNINDLNDLKYRNNGDIIGKENKLNNINNCIINDGNNTDKMNNQNIIYNNEKNIENNLVKENNYFQISHFNQNNDNNFIKDSFQIVKGNPNYDNNKNNINKENIKIPLIPSILNYKVPNNNTSEDNHNMNNKINKNISELNNIEPEGDKNKYKLNNNETNNDENHSYNNNEKNYNQNMINDYDINNNNNDNASWNNKKNNYKGMKISKDNIINLLDGNSNNRVNVNYKGEEEDDKIKNDKDSINGDLINNEKINEKLLHSSRSNYDIEEDDKNNKINEDFNKNNEDNNVNKNAISNRDENNNNDEYEDNTYEINSNKDDKNNNNYENNKNNNANYINDNNNNNKEENKINAEKGKDEKPINYIMSQISPYKEYEHKNQLIPEKESNYKKYLYDSPANKNQKKNITKNKNNKEYNFENEIEIGNDEISGNNFTNKQIPEKDKNSKSNKKVSFDDHLIYIKYDEDEYVTNLLISDNNGKTLPYKERDFTKYLRLLTSVSHTSKIKPVMLNIEKKNKKKKTKIMKRNIEYLKEVAKSGNVFSSAKDHHHHNRKNVEKSIDKNIEYYNTENLKNCKKFLENPQQFFTEELCDTVLQSYNLAPKENSSRSQSANKKKSKSKNKK